MSEECTHDCGSCGKDCADRTTQSAQSFLAQENAKSSIKKVIAVVSGKGGVGKSLVTSLLSVLSQRAGNKTAIIDADITGPSIPKTFNLEEENAYAKEDNIIPVETKTGIKLMSINLLLEDAGAPVIWRGPILAGTVKQFWSDVLWGDIDCMFVDCPPGTGDVPLTVFQSLPIDGIIVVTSPQDLVSMIVGKAVRMAEMMHIPVLGIVENMSYFVCDNCKEKHYIFGESSLAKTAEEYGIQNIAKIPIEPKLRKQVDAGDIEDFEGGWLDEIYKVIENVGLK
ncbi:MAG: Mrp/NBP35 family ATP-binding protein [Clostridium sp.]|nr:Mrp/NBP35 family ATP-binding protein [Clostridium sp.]MCM1207514.1 Mrp/NBP35 family ATP-binding protein [Ruminococcus sp.]